MIGNGGVGFVMAYKKGDLFFKPTDKSEFKTIGANYYPANNSYPVSEKQDFKFVDEYFELIGTSRNPKEYYITKKYTQYELDNIIKKLKIKP